MPRAARRSLRNATTSLAVGYESILFHLRRQRAEGNPEELGGCIARRGVAQCVGDLQSLDGARRTSGGLIERTGKIERLASSVILRRSHHGEIARLDDVAVTQDRSPFERVL